MTAQPARRALVLLLFINLFNYVDRQVLAAVVPSIEHSFFGAGGAAARSAALDAIQDWCRAHLGFKPELALIGVLSMAFMVLYMVGAPIFGRLAERHSRWVLVGVGGHPLEPGQRRLGAGGDFLRTAADALLRRGGRGGVRPRGADDPLGSLPRRGSRPHPRVVLHGHSGGQRPRLRARRRGRRLDHRRDRVAAARDPRRELALGVLSRGAAGDDPRALGASS